MPLAAIPDAVLLIDATGVIIDANVEAYVLLGYEPGALVGRALRSLFTPETWALCPASFWVGGEGPSTLYEVEAIDRQGTFLPVEVCLRAWGDPPVCLISLRDLRPRYAADAERDDLKFLSRLVREAAVPVAIRVMGGRLVLWNRAFERLTGYPPEELARMSMERLAPCEDAPTLREHVFRLLKNPPIDGEADHYAGRLIRRDGSLRDIEVAISLYRDSVGRPQYMCQFVTDVTERKRAEARLRESEERNRTLLQSLPQRVFFKDRDLRFRSVNAAFAADFGKQPADLVGCDDYDLFPRALADKYRADDTRVLDSREPEYLEEVNFVNGVQRIVEVVKAPVIEDDGEVIGLLGLYTDITERKRLQAQVIQADKLAALGKMVAGVAHEINNPLAAISGSAQLLESHPDPEVQSDARLVLRMAGRASKIVRSLLTFARGHNGERRTAAPADLVTEALEIIAHKVRQESVDVHLDFADDAPPICVIENQIHQVLLNLLTNAVQALQGRPCADRRIAVTTRCCERDGTAWAVFTVSDNGTGIPQDILGRIFDPFFTTKEIGQGTGLGLSICHGIVEAHQGELAVQSAVGEGTTFTLSLPAIR